MSRYGDNNECRVLVFYLTRTCINAACLEPKSLWICIFQRQIKSAIGVMCLLIIDVINNGSQGFF